MKKYVFNLSFFILFILMFLPPVSLSAVDFGLAVKQYVSYGDRGAEKNSFTYQGDILPRLSFLIGTHGEFLLSAGFTYGYENEFYFAPELLHTEFSYRFGKSGIKAGRIPYVDPLSFIANGLFDGLQFYHNSSLGTFNIGAWYTGLLYKKTAYITMTAEDQEKYDSVLNYGDFVNTYFAPSRLLASFDWEHPSVGNLLRLRAALTGQIDLTNTENKEKYHSQYFTLKAGIPIKSFLIELGGSFEASESVMPEEKTEFAVAFAWMLGLYWNLPTSFNSRISLAGSFAGGRTGDTLRAFVPVTTKTYGNILEAKLSGLSVIELNYTARFVPSFGASLSALCFIRSDLATYQGYPLGGEASNGYILGTEFFARLIWSPLSDLQLNLGGGAFLPSLGNVSDKKPLWRLELSAILAIL